MKLYKIILYNEVQKVLLLLRGWNGNGNVRINSNFLRMEREREREFPKGRDFNVPQIAKFK